MINLKKVFALSACMVLTVSMIAACGKKKTDTDNDNTNGNSEMMGTSVSVEEMTLKWSDSELDSSWDVNNSTLIELKNDTVLINGDGAVSEGCNITINSSGTYILSGTLEDGSVTISSGKDDKVKVVLNQVNITSKTSEPLVVEKADEVILVLADNTVNYLADVSRTIQDSDKYSAVLSSKSDLVINGEGTLKIDANYRHGIKSSDDLKIVSGTIEVEAVEDGIIGKDLLGIRNGAFTINSKDDGLKANNDEDTEKGNIVIEGGSYVITTGNDAVQAENGLYIYGGDFNIKTGEGSGNVKNNFMAESQDDESIKGLKAEKSLLIKSGEFYVDSEDDAIHCNGDILLLGGTYEILSGDDGIHSDSQLEIESVSINIKKSYEGLEAATILINSGDIDIVSSDDGINASNGNDNDMMPGNMGGFGRVQEKENSSQSEENTSIAVIYINGGNVFINADGDGIDSNGDLYINGGEVVVCGPTSDGDCALDYETSFVLNGGTVMAFGSSGMLESPTAANNGGCIVTSFNTQQAGTDMILYDSDKNVVMSYSSIPKKYSSVVLYSDKIKVGSDYTLNAGEASVSVTVTQIENNGMGGFGRPDNGGMNKPGGDMQLPEGMSMPDGDMQPPEGMSMPEGGMQPPEGMSMPDGMEKPDKGDEFGGAQKPDMNRRQSDGTANQDNKTSENIL